MSISKTHLLLFIGAIATLAFLPSWEKPEPIADDFASPTPSVSTRANFALPIENARERVTKKPFGIYITPKNSPVQPEKFTGYHTGADFETTTIEALENTPVFAVCKGPLIEKRSATGYGGLAVQECSFENQPITIVYGHLKLSSIKAAGVQLEPGMQFAILGKGYTPETDGERKHLHLGIHRGKSINIRGYVATQPELSAWIDPLTILPR